MIKVAFYIDGERLITSYRVLRKLAHPWKEGEKTASLLLLYLKKNQIN